MGREIRRVPLDWEHPKDEDTGHYKPLRDSDFETAEEKWIAERTLWRQFQHPAQIKDPNWYKVHSPRYVDYAGTSPYPGYYRERQWTPDEATAYQIYETVTEGTPVSPVFASLEELIAWLVDEGYSERAAREFAHDGWAPSMVMVVDANGSRTVVSDINALDVLPPEDATDSAGPEATP